MRLLRALAYCVLFMTASSGPTPSLAGSGSSSCPAQPYAVSTSSALYGTDATFESLDLYTPAGRSGEPLVIFVHGDGWTRGDKSQYRELGNAFAGCGIALAAIDYPLAPQARADAQAGDVARAVKWALDNAAGKGYSSAKIFLMGHGSGAELAAFTALNAKLLSVASVPAAAISGVVALDGSGYDPSAQAANAAANPTRYQAFAAAFGADPSTWKQYDCANYVSVKAPRFLVVHGSEDFLAPDSASLQFVQELQRAHAGVTYLSAEGRDHSGVLVALVRTPDDPTMLAIERFVLGS